MIDNESVILELNKLLTIDEFNFEQVDYFIQSLKEHNKVIIKLIDFEYYNEERLDKANKEKIICVQLQNFEKAASNRDLEMECKKYIDLKNELGIVNSEFHFEQNYLLYFYLGTSKNDRYIKANLKMKYQ
jgi:hypothetical protein